MTYGRGVSNIEYNSKASMQVAQVIRYCLECRADNGGDMPHLSPYLLGEPLTAIFALCHGFQSFGPLNQDLRPRAVADLKLKGPV
jgi:hypothetical protein